MIRVHKGSHTCNFYCRPNAHAVVAHGSRNLRVSDIVNAIEDAGCLVLGAEVAPEGHLIGHVPEGRHEPYTQAWLVRFNWKDPSRG